MAISGLSYLTPGATAVAVVPGPPGPPGPEGQQGIIGPIGTIGPIGVTPNLTMGIVTSLATGQPATASISGAGTTAPSLNLGLPAGPVGPANTLTIGTVATLPSTANATATINGTAPNQSLSLGLPVGPPGATGNGTGNVLGPAGGSTTNHVVLFADTTGTALKDGGALGGAATMNVGTTTGTVPDAGSVEYTSRKGQASGYAGLDSTGRVPSAQMGAAFPISGIVAKTAAYTILPADTAKMFDLTGSFALTLPAVSNASANAPLYYHFRKRDGSGVCQVACAGSDTFASGRTTISLYQEDATFVSFGGAWYSPPGGRQRGWVTVGTTTISGAVASVSISGGFSDTELTEMDFTLDAIGFTSADTLVARIARNGATVTSYTAETIYGSGASVSASTLNTAIPLCFFGSPSNIFASLTITGLLGQQQRISAQGAPAGNYNLSRTEASAAGTNGIIQSIQFFGTGGYSLNAGAITQKAFRR